MFLRIFSVLAAALAGGWPLVSQAGLPAVPLPPAGQWVSEAASALDAVSDYLSPRLSVSGDTRQGDDQTAGDLNLVGRDILVSQNTLDLHFSHSASRKLGDQQQSLTVNYTMPLAGNEWQFSAERRQYQNVLRETDRQLDGSGQYRGVHVSSSRNLGSLAGIGFRQIAQYSGSHVSDYEQSQWVGDTRRQHSSVGLQCAVDGSLPGGLAASAQVTAVGGVQYEQVVSADDSQAYRNRYQKLALDASAGRPWHRWHLGVRGRYQLAPGDLPDDEQIQVGGAGLMSGFDGHTVYGAEGGWVRMQALSPTYGLPLMDRFRSRISVAVMQGWSPVGDAHDRRFASVSAGEVSLTLRARKMSANLTVGRLLESDRPDLAVPARPDVSLSLVLGI
ncbi:ShlB/FhaC/HecB family hemolysin secretion/activation protein [Marinobacter sp. C2H3]|uniref:ShlB/FhaC/HecB family hemolysin secretion/activation protein n=1 Tax=Marinobacter sp. C2H3 TaxID=3119003 RepID=UPI00300EC7AD